MFLFMALNVGALTYCYLLFQGFEEGKEMLTKAQNDFKDYDNESAFSVKINHALQLSKRKSEERSSH